MVFNGKFGQEIKNSFSGKVEQALQLSKNFLSKLEFPKNLFWSLWKA